MFPMWKDCSTADLEGVGNQVGGNLSASVYYFLGGTSGNTQC